MQRTFEPDQITIRNNPFSSTKSVSIVDGVFMKDLKNNCVYISNTDPCVDIGIIKKLQDKIEEIETAKSPQHIFVLAEYGQGKSFSLKRIQDKIFINYNAAIISYSIGGNNENLKGENNFFQDKIMEDVEFLFQNLDERLYTNKETIDRKYQLTSADKTFHQFLEAYDNAFSELNILVYVFIDELDKIVISSISDEKISRFLEDLKLIGDTCGKAISLIVAGTPNCLVKINQLSIDYGQRFDKVESNYLTIDQTTEYISKKCLSKLKYVGYFPFEKNVIKQIHSVANGNIRRIESICRDLWFIASREKTKINITRLHRYIKEKLFEPIKTIFESTINNNVIDFVSDLFLHNSKMGINNVKKLPYRKQKEIESFLNSTDLIKKVSFSYIMMNDLKEKIGEVLVN